jgi:glucuronate isomerase
MNTDLLVQDLVAELETIPIIDVHTHLVGSRLGARGLHDILLYHMAVSDLYAAGCPSGRRLTEYPGWPTREEAHQRLREALPFLNYVQNTSTSWGIRTILAELYHWREPVSEQNWETLDGLIRERADDAAWHHQILRRLNIRRVGTEWARREGGEGDNVLQYALEWGFFTRCQWGEYDTALYELEKCWGKQPGSPSPIGAGKRPVPEREIRSLADVHAAIAHYVAQFPPQVLATATHLSTDLDLSPVDEVQMEAALKSRPQAGPRERDIYASYINEHYLAALAKARPDVVFQFSFGAEPLPHETGSRLDQRSIRQLGELVARHPGLRFQTLLSSQHAHQSLCTLARELPNLSIAGYWWHNFFPSIIRKTMAERLEMLPLNKHVGFFSDAYCVDWVYAKTAIVRRCLAQVLAEQLRQGWYSRQQGLEIARAILYQTPQQLLGFTPSPLLSA